MAIPNAGFDDAGAWPGLPDGWAVRAYTGAERLAASGDLILGPLGIERFVWAPSVLEAVPFAAAIFDVEAYEDFFEGWIDGPFVEFWSAGFEEAAGFNPEDFDWMGAPWLALWSELAPGNQEEAADDDLAVPGYILTWAAVPSTEAASFDGPTSVEIFDSWTPLP